MYVSVAGFHGCLVFRCLPQIIQLSVDTCVFQFGTVINNAALDIPVHVSACVYTL